MKLNPLFFLTLLLALFTNCQTGEQKATTPESVYHSEVFQNPAGDWGYRILEGEAMRINQPHIPAINGIRGFSSAEKAEKTAAFIISKMDAGYRLPSVTPAELDSLGVLN